MVKRIVSLCGIFFIIFAVSAFPARCQDGTGAVIKVVEGNVVSVDPQGSSIVVKTYRNTVFSVPSDAKLTNPDGFEIQLSDIDPGNYVTVEYYDSGSGEHIAKNINVEYKN